MIGAWQRAFESGGVAALHRAAESRCKAMAEQSKDDRADRKKADKRTRQELFDEIEQLRMENTYLKKLKALARAEEPARDTEPKSCKS
jgi:transposase